MNKKWMDPGGPSNRKRQAFSIRNIIIYIFSWNSILRPDGGGGGGGGGGGVFIGWPTRKKRSRIVTLKAEGGENNLTDSAAPFFSSSLTVSKLFSFPRGVGQQVGRNRHICGLVIRQQKRLPDIFLKKNAIIVQKRRTDMVVGRRATCHHQHVLRSCVG